MAGSFWNSWALWEKMCFVLGCAIFLTICCGFIKLGYNHWKLRKYTAIAAKKNEEAVWHELQHAESVKRARARDIPFGVRAIQSGIEVDGVWISRPNTPTSSAHGSPTLAPSAPPSPANNQKEPSPAQPRRTSIASIPRLSMPQPTYPYHRAFHEMSNSSSVEPSTYQNHYEQAKPGRNSSGLPTSQSANDLLPAYNSQTSSQTRSNNPQILVDNTTLNRPNPNQPPVLRPSRDHTDSIERRKYQQTSSSSSESANGPGHSSSLCPDHIDFPHHPSYDTAHLHLNPIDNRHYVDRDDEDLRSLATHRRSQVAEAGQLVPRKYRNRSSGASSDWESTRSLTNERHIIADYNVSSDSSPPHEDSNPFITPLNSPVLGSSPNEPPSFSSFLESDPANPAKQSVRLLDGAEELKFEEAKASSSFDTPQACRQSHVIRKVNSGFEILQPGTFESQRQNNDEASGNQGQPEEKRPPRKLQKKKIRSGSIASQRS